MRRGPRVQPGAPGAAGADGQLRIYGDGSAGTRTVNADETFDDANRQYTDFTVASGVTLTIPSGTVIRWHGFTMRARSSSGWQRRRGEAVRAETIDSAYRTPWTGRRAGGSVARRAGPAGDFYFGGFGGTGLTAAQALGVLQPGVNAGGGGSCGIFSGSAGGGGLTILAAGPIVDGGTLRADGDSQQVRRRRRGEASSCWRPGNG